MLGFAMAALGAWNAMEANSAADAQAAAQNAANAETANRSIAKANEDNKKRKEELLSRFNVSSSKLKDTSKDVFQGTATQLTALDMELVKAQSVSNNKLATKHITGRLADRMRTSIDISGAMEKGNILQNTKAQLTDLGNKLETMTSDTETQELNLNIDLSNSITSANNQLVSSYQYSQSSGLGGVLSSGISTGMSAYSIDKGAFSW